MAQQKENVTNILNIFSGILTAVGLVSLFVAGLSIMNVMLSAVTERTREIGIKKALGASRRTIVTEFLTEAVILTVMGAAVGVIVGIAISWAGVSALGLTLALQADKIIEIILIILKIALCESGRFAFNTHNSFFGFGLNMR